MIIETANQNGLVNSTTPSNQMEISRMLNKLRTLVPGIPPEQKMSTLEIMQHVIDYINELETVLEDDNDSSKPTTNGTTPLHHHTQSHQTELVN